MRAPRGEVVDQDEEVRLAKLMELERDFTRISQSDRATIGQILQAQTLAVIYRNFVYPYYTEIRTRHDAGLDERGEEVSFSVSVGKLMVAIDKSGQVNKIFEHGKTSSGKPGYTGAFMPGGKQLLANTLGKTILFVHQYGGDPPETNWDSAEVFSPESSSSLVIKK